jgi:Tol biopolymer transport system component
VPLPVAFVNRVIYHDGNQRVGELFTIRPDGTALTSLGEGEAPAWTPNGQLLIFQRDHQLWRSAPDGSGATPIPNTAFAYEPAISPDGRWLTYSSDQNQEGLGYPKPYDIWAVGF